MRKMACTWHRHGMIQSISIQSIYHLRASTFLQRMLWRMITYAMTMAPSIIQNPDEDNATVYDQNPVRDATTTSETEFEQSCDAEASSETEFELSCGD